MAIGRRALIGLAALAPLAAGQLPAWGGAAMSGSRRVLSDFRPAEPFVAEGLAWRGFSDRVMGGVSDAEFGLAEIDGLQCARLTGRVTRDSGGGFIQMALDLARGRGSFDAAAYSGIEILVHGNDEDYNIHVRTADCGWYDESYRNTFRAAARWQTLRFPWAAFVPNGLEVPLDPARLQRIGLLGWMREFRADLALAELALYR